jgi:hypothetical protein
MGVDAKGELHSFDHVGTSALGGLTRTLTLMNQVSGSVPVRSFEGLIALSKEIRVEGARLDASRFITSRTMAFPSARTPLEP